MIGQEQDVIFIPAHECAFDISDHDSPVSVFLEFIEFFGCIMPGSWKARRLLTALGRNLCSLLLTLGPSKPPTLVF
jgi:hypothetical protein